MSNKKLYKIVNICKQELCAYVCLCTCVPLCLCVNVHAPAHMHEYLKMFLDFDENRPLFIPFIHVHWHICNLHEVHRRRKEHNFPSCSPFFCLHAFLQRIEATRKLILKKTFKTECFSVWREGGVKRCNFHNEFLDFFPIPSHLSSALC